MFVFRKNSMKCSSAGKIASMCLDEIWLNLTMPCLQRTGAGYALGNYSQMLLWRKSCLKVLSVEYMPFLQKLLLAVPAEVDTCRTGDGDQALANKVLFNTAVTYQVIANSLWFKAKKVVYISSINTHTKKKSFVLYLSVEQWILTMFAICCNSPPTIA